MRLLITAIGLSLMALTATAQPVYKQQPGSLVNIIPYKIQVSDLFTTIILFPFEVKDADMGVGKLLATKIPDMKNILKLKAESPNLDTTSLYVITGDGKVHVFQVTYTALPTPLAYELNLQGQLQLQSGPPVFFQEQPYSQADLQQWVQSIREHSGSSIKTVRIQQLQLTLRDVYTVGSFMFFKFTLTNQSSLPYAPGWLQLYTKNRRTPKRTAVQEISIQPIYMDSLQELSGNSSRELIVSFRRQTLPRNRSMYLELHEDNGGRNVRFKMRNRYLLSAKTVQ